ncbi:unnamed protein product [Pocillopora meandrina]|uniref:Enoyl-CoA hydratase n=1 Tax=Pocillopora meandrina TaxID=46732 RepID=A0AAU9VW44_9CNID|nr:unnamed protein product [Pocillopora meandrina]
MEMVLTGDPISAEDAQKSGLVSKVFPAEGLVNEAFKTASKTSSLSKIAAQIANTGYEKDCILRKECFTQNFQQ